MGFLSALRKPPAQFRDNSRNYGGNGVYNCIYVIFFVTTKVIGAFIIWNARIIDGY